MAAFFLSPQTASRLRVLCAVRGIHCIVQRPKSPNLRSAAGKCRRESWSVAACEHLAECPCAGTRAFRCAPQAQDVAWRRQGTALIDRTTPWLPLFDLA